MQNSKIKSHYHCVYNLQYHLVLVTRYRKKCFNKEILPQLEDISKRVCEKWSCTLTEFGGEEDHIHLLLEAHPAMDMSKFVGNLKTVTSRLIKKEHKKHFEKYFCKPAIWTRAYCLLTTSGATIETIKKYIENQGAR